jgi:hypothetical protein
MKSDMGQHTEIDHHIEVARWVVVFVALSLLVGWAIWSSHTTCNTYDRNGRFPVCFCLGITDSKTGPGFSSFKHCQGLVIYKRSYDAVTGLTLPQI